MSERANSTGQTVGLRINGGITAYADVLLDYTPKPNDLMSALAIDAEAVPVAFRLTADSAAVYAAPDGVVTHRSDIRDATYGDALVVECVLLSPDQYDLAPALIAAGWLVGRRA